MADTPVIIPGAAPPVDPPVDPPKYWPETWREDYVKSITDKDGKPLDEVAQDKLMKRLSRYASPKASLDAMIAAQNKISSGKLMKTLDKEATSEELADYRSALGIPENPKDYDLTLADGLVIGDEDKARIDEFLVAAHGAHFTPEQVKTGLNWFYAKQEADIVEQYNADVKFHNDAVEELRQEWGGPGEYKANQNLMANYLASDFAEGVDILITGARLPDGRLLGNHPDIVRGFVAKARAANPIGALVPGTGTKQHDALVNEIKEMEGRMRNDPTWHNDKAANDRYMKLVAIRDKVSING